MQLALGSNMRSLREEAGLTQTQLGELIGMSQTWISRLEQGDENPTLKTMILLADALDVHVHELLMVQVAA